MNKIECCAGNLRFERLAKGAHCPGLKTSSKLKHPSVQMTRLHCSMIGTALTRPRRHDTVHSIDGPGWTWYVNKGAYMALNRWCIISGVGDDSDSEPNGRAEAKVMASGNGVWVEKCKEVVTALVFLIDPTAESTMAPKRRSLKKIAWNQSQPDRWGLVTSSACLLWKP